MNILARSLKTRMQVIRSNESEHERYNALKRSTTVLNALQRVSHTSIELQLKAAATPKGRHTNGR